MSKPRIEVQIAAEVGNALNGLKRATEAINQFKTAAGAAGGRISVSLGNTAKRAGVAAREIKTEFSDSFAEVEAAIRASGATAGNWSQQMTKEAREAARAVAMVPSAVSTSIQRATASLSKGFGRGVVHPSLQTDLRLLDKNLKQVSLSAQQAGSSLQRNIGRTGVTAVRGGTSAAISFGHILQDLPYGINGVANNITQLTTQMGYMAASAKAAGVSMRSALLASITNPATIAVLAVSAITTAMVFFNGRVGKAKKETKDLEDSLLSLSDTLSKGSTDAVRDTTQMDALYRATQDVRRSTEDRLRAVDALQKEYPSYFQNIKDEAFLNGEAEAAYKSLRVSIIRVAQAKALQNQIFERAQKDLELQPKRLEALEKLTAAQQALTLHEKTANKGSQGYLATQQMLTLQTNKARTAFQELTTQSEKYSKEMQDLEKQLDNYSALDLVGGGSQNNTGTDNTLKEFESLSKEILKDSERLFQQLQEERYRDLRQSFLYYNEQEERAKKLGISLAQITLNRRNEEQQINDKYDALETAAAEKLRVQLEQTRQKLSDNILKITEQNKVDLLGEEEQETYNINKTYDDRLKNLSNFYAAQITLAYGNFAEMLRLQTELNAALAQNEDARTKTLTDAERKRQEAARKEQEKALRDMANLQKQWTRTLSRELEGVLFEGENVFQSLGRAFKKMVSQMVADALAADLTKALFRGAGGAVGGFLGRGGGGIGGLLKGLVGLGGLLGGIPFANGGIVSGPTLGLVGEYPGARSNPEVIAPLSDLAGMLDRTGVSSRVYVEGQISNDVIYLSNKRGAQKHERFFGN